MNPKILLTLSAVCIPLLMNGCATPNMLCRARSSSQTTAVNWRDPTLTAEIECDIILGGRTKTVVVPATTISTSSVAE